MRNLIPMLALMLLLLLTPLASFAGSSPGRTYVVNATQDGPKVYGRCSSSELVTSSVGEHSNCYCPDAAAFQIGTSEETLKVLNVTNEGHFDITLSDNTRLQGALETIDHLVEGVHSYYVYVWKIEVGK